MHTCYRIVAAAAFHLTPTATITVLRSEADWCAALGLGAETESV